MKRRPGPAAQIALPFLAREGADASALVGGSQAGATARSADPLLVASTVTVVRRRGTRRYVLRVLDDGTVRVTVPWWGSRRGALAFAASQQPWIERQLATRPRRRVTPWQAGRIVALDGTGHPIDVVEDGSAWLAGHCVAATAGDPEALRRGVQAWLRARARQELPVALQALASEHGLIVTRVTVRDQVSRWGSCSRQGAISLNWRLVQVPPWVRHYVLVHELMHRRQLNHSPRFWALVAAACPHYLEARRWLRTDGQALFD